MRQFTYTISIPIGLHARPAAQLVETVKGLSSTVTIQKGIKTAPGGRLISLMLLEAHQGDSVTVTLEGPQEEQDAHTLLHFFQTHL